jgi:hypothetical protein
MAKSQQVIDLCSDEEQDVQISAPAKGQRRTRTKPAVQKQVHECIDLTADSDEENASKIPIDVGSSSSSIVSTPSQEASDSREHDALVLDAAAKNAHNSGDSFRGSFAPSLDASIAASDEVFPPNCSRRENQISNQVRAPLASSSSGSTSIPAERIEVGRPKELASSKQLSSSVQNTLPQLQVCDYCRHAKLWMLTRACRYCGVGMIRCCSLHLYEYGMIAFSCVETMTII